MNWPLPLDFNEAVQNPAVAFSDPDLKAGQTVVGPTGLPLPRSGNFADVYQVRGADGKDWAAKCFTRPVTGLDQRYAKVQEALTRLNLPFTVGFKFLNEGVRVRGRSLPLLKMEWVDGLLLNQVVRDQAGNPKALDALGLMWVRLCKRLRDAGIAHGDLQHGNVLLVPGPKAGSYGLKLIDYDGMYVPALANSPSGEAGHANFQHPTRAAKGVYSPDLDRFPHLVIATALKGLSVLGQGLWDRYDTGDNLLFTEDDFKNPAGSRLMRELWETKNPGLQALVGNLAIASLRPLPQTPWLDVIAPDGNPIPLPPDYAQAAAQALGLAAAAPQDIPADDAFAFDTPAAEAPPQPAAKLGSRPMPKLARPQGTRMAARDPEPAKKFPVVPVAVAAGVLVLAVAGIGAYFGSGGKKPDETVQAPPTNTKTAPTKPDDRGKTTPKPPDPTPPEPQPAPPEPPPPAVPQPADPPPAGPPGPVDMAALPRLKPTWDRTHTEKSLTQLAFTRDGTKLVAVSASKPEVPVIDAATGNPVDTFSDHTSRVAGVGALSDGNVATLGQSDPFAIVWDPATRRAVGKLQVPALPETSGSSRPVFAVSPDGKYAVTGKSGTVVNGMVEPSTLTLAETATGRQVAAFDFRHGSIQFTPDGTRLVVVDDRPMWVRTFQLPTGKVEGEWRADPKAMMLPVAVSADARWLACWNLSSPDVRKLHVVTALDGRPVAAVPLTAPSHIVRGAFSPDGKWLAVQWDDRSPGPARDLVLVSTATWTPAAVAPLPFPLNGNGHGIQFSPTGTSLAVLQPAGRVITFPVSPDQVAVAPKPPDPTPQPSPTPAPTPGSGMPLWAKVSSDGEATRAFFSGDGQYVLVPILNRGVVDVYDARTGTPGRQFKGHRPNSSVTSVWPLDRGRVASYATFSDPPLVWEPKTGNVLGPLVKPELLPTAAPTPLGGVIRPPYFAASPNGRYVVAAQVGPSKAGVPGQPRQYDPAPFRLIDTATDKAVVAGEWTNGAVQFTADSETAFIAETSGKFRRVKLPSGQVEAEWQMPPTANSRTLAGHPSIGDRVLYYGRTQGQQVTGLYLLDGKTGRVIRRVGTGGTVRTDSVTLSPDGRMILSLQFDGNPNERRYAGVVSDAETGNTLRRVKLDIALNDLGSAEFSPDARLLAVYVRSKKEVAVFDVSGDAVAIVPKPKDPDPKPPTVARSPVPEDAALAKAEAEVRELLKAEYAKKTAAEKKALAQKLLKLADQSADSPAARFVMLRDARELATEANDPALTLQAIEAQAKLFTVDEARLMLAALEKIAAAASGPAALRAVADAALTGADEAAGADEYDVALKLAQVAAGAARKGLVGGGLVEDAETRAAQLKKAAEAFAAARPAVETLKTSPDDPAANLAVGRFRCFVQARWEEGLKLLAKGSDPALKAAAEQDLAAPRMGVADVKVADAWWDVAQAASDAERRGAEARARFWYTRSVAGLTGLNKVRAESRLGFTLNGVEYRPGLVTEFTARPVGVLKKKGRVDPVLDFSSFSDPDVRDVKGVSVVQLRWSGFVLAPQAGRYKLVAATTDPVRVRVNNKPVIDTTTAKTGKAVGTIALRDHPVPVTIDFATPIPVGAGHTLKLNWVAPGGEGEVLVPAEVLFHDRKAEPAAGK